VREKQEAKFVSNTNRFNRCARTRLLCTFSLSAHLSREPKSNINAVPHPQCHYRASAAFRSSIDGVREKQEAKLVSNTDRFNRCARTRLLCTFSLSAHPSRGPKSNIDAVPHAQCHHRASAAFKSSFDGVRKKQEAKLVSNTDRFNRCARTRLLCTFSLSAHLSREHMSSIDAVPHPQCHYRASAAFRSSIDGVREKQEAKFILKIDRFNRCARARLLCTFSPSAHPSRKYMSNIDAVPRSQCHDEAFAVFRSPIHGVQKKIGGETRS